MVTHMTSEVKFIVDEMLGNIARWLRILGFDTIYARDLRVSYNGKSFDTYLLRIAILEKRILITRDKEIVQRAKHYGVKVISILQNSKDIVTTLGDILIKSGVSHPPVNYGILRCPICNGILRPIAKENVKTLVPEKSWKFAEEFFKCSNCGKIYWKGSHWRKISKVIKSLSEILSKNSDHSIKDKQKN